VYLSYLNTHTHLFWTGPTGCNLVKLEGPEIDYDRCRAPSSWSPGVSELHVIDVFFADS